MRSLNKAILSAILLRLVPLGLQAARLEEERLVGYLHDQWKTNPPGATSVLQTVESVLPRLSLAPLQAIARALRSLNLLESGRTTDALKTLESLLNAPDTPPAIAEWCKRWLTRLDREKVREALTAYYRREIRFPDTLDPLKTLTPPPPMTDRWGTPWRYRLTPLKRIRSVEAQTYALESVSLGRLSDLASALAQPRPEVPSIRPISLVPSSGQGPLLIRFETSRPPVEQAILSERSSWKGVTLVYVGESILILVENDFLFILRRPER